LHFLLHFPYSSFRPTRPSTPLFFYFFYAPSISTLFLVSFFRFKDLNVTAGAGAKIFQGGSQFSKRDNLSSKGQRIFNEVQPVFIGGNSIFKWVNPLSKGDSPYLKGDIPF
jgi:hypothetical protein